MVPVIVHQIGDWLDRFTDTLNCWETLLCDLRSAYFRKEDVQVKRLLGSVETAKSLMVDCKSDRESILERAAAHGYPASNLRELSRLLDGQWPALWTHRLMGLENQISRIQQLCVSLWLHSTDSRELVSELTQLLGTKSPQISRDLRLEKEPLEDQSQPVIIPFERKAA